LAYFQKMTQAYGLTHVGNKRNNNQDSFLIDEDLKLYIVADGMGGHKGGGTASKIAVESVKNFLEARYNQEDFSPEVDLVEAFQEANAQVFEKSQEGNKELLGMGTTLVACMIWKNNVFFANVGDSRAYLLRNSKIWRITEDHSIINNQIKNGLIEADQIPFLTHSNLITRSIGFFPKIQVDLFEREFSKKEFYLLCSDGLNELPEQKILELSQDYAPESLADQCVKKVLDGDANDNVTVVVITP